MELNRAHKSFATGFWKKNLFITAGQCFFFTIDEKAAYVTLTNKDHNGKETLVDGKCKEVTVVDYLAALKKAEGNRAD